MRRSEVKLALSAMPMDLRIGIDFDNTIISYDEVFCAAAKSGGLIDSTFKGRKQAVRDAIRSLPNGELAWQRLQGKVYGKGVVDAMLIEGVETFLRRCTTQPCTVMIVSHKTEYGHYDPDKVNLRKAALDWMAARGLFDGTYAIPAENVYFESSRAEKLRRIGALSLTYFIDDLEEVLSDPGFPPNVRRILFSNDHRSTTVPYSVCSTWRDIERAVFEGIDPR
jgi:hypothetical protein